MSYKTPSPIIATLLILGGAVFGLLGALHAIYTLLDLHNPQYLVPVDPSVAQAMANSALRLSGGRTNMWQAWIGFNFSHSLGLLLVAGLALWAGFRFNTLPVGIIMPALTLIGCTNTGYGETLLVSHGSFYARTEGTHCNLQGTYKLFFRAPATAQDAMWNSIALGGCPCSGSVVRPVAGR